MERLKHGTTKVRMALLIAFGLLLLVAACAQPTPTPAPTATPTPTPGPTPTARVVVVTPTPTPTPVFKGEGQVVFFMQSSYEAEFRKYWVAPFEQQTGCKMTIFGGGSLAMGSRLQAEAAKPTVDVIEEMFSVHIKLKFLRLLEKNNPNIVTNAKDVIPVLKDVDDTGMPNRIAGIELVYREDSLSKAGIAPPTSWLDMADPRFKGRVATMSTSTPEGHYFLAAVARALGENEKMDKQPKLWEWVEKKYMPNILLAGAGSAPIQKAIQDDAAWVALLSSTGSARVKEAGISLGVVNHKEGNVLPAGFASAVKGGPNPVCAQLLLNFVASKEFQDRRAEIFKVGPVRNDTVLRPEDIKLVGTMDRIKTQLNLDYEAIAVQEQNWTMNWDRIFRK